MIGDTSSQKNNVKYLIAAFHSERAVGERRMKSCGDSHHIQMILQNFVWSSEIQAYFGYIIGFFIISYQLHSAVFKTVHTYFLIKSLFICSVLSLYFAVVARCRYTNPVLYYVVLFQHLFKHSFTLLISDE